jgi:hypothetical protein
VIDAASSELRIDDVVEERAEAAAEIVAIVMLVFGAIVCYLAWRAGLDDLDAALGSRAQTLAGGLRPAGAGTFDLILPPDPAAPLDLSFYIVWAPSGAPGEAGASSSGRLCQIPTVQRWASAAAGRLTRTFRQQHPEAPCRRCSGSSPRSSSSTVSLRT